MATSNCAGFSVENLESDFTPTVVLIFWYEANYRVKLESVLPSILSYTRRGAAQNLMVLLLLLTIWKLGKILNDILNTSFPTPTHTAHMPQQATF